MDIENLEVIGKLVTYNKSVLKDDEHNPVGDMYPIFMSLPAVYLKPKNMPKLSPGNIFQQVAKAKDWHDYKAAFYFLCRLSSTVRPAPPLAARDTQPTHAAPLNAARSVSASTPILPLGFDPCARRPAHAHGNDAGGSGGSDPHPPCPGPGTLVSHDERRSLSAWVVRTTHQRSNAPA